MIELIGVDALLVLNGASKAFQIQKRVHSAFRCRCYFQMRR